MYRGLLVSLGPKGLTAYAQQQAIEQEILARRKQNPQDSWADLFEANIQTLKRNYDPALELLRKVEPEKLSPADQTRYRNLMMDISDGSFAGGLSASGQGVPRTRSVRESPTRNA